MKRHNFAGLRATHGVSVSHRSHGSTGQRQDPGKVFKGKKMAGHMGDVRVTTQNLQVVRTDADQGIILVRGAVPGAKGGWLLVRDAVKRKLPQGVPTPAAIRAKAQPAAEAAAVEAAAAAEKPDGTPGENAGRRGGRHRHAVGRGFRARAARRHPAAHGALAAAKRQQGTHKTKRPRRDQGDLEEDVPPEGHRQRPPRQQGGAAVPRRRQGLRPGRAQPRDRPAEEGAGAGAEACAFGQGEGRMRSSCSRIWRRPRAKTKAARWRSSPGSGSPMR